MEWLFINCSRSNWKWKCCSLWRRETRETQEKQKAQGQEPATNWPQVQESNQATMLEGNPFYYWAICTPLNDMIQSLSMLEHPWGKETFFHLPHNNAVIEGSTVGRRGMGNIWTLITCTFTTQIHPFTIEHVTVPFNNMQTLTFITQQTTAFFAAINHNHGNSQQPLQTVTNKID